MNKPKPSIFNKIKAIFGFRDKDLHSELSDLIEDVDNPENNNQEELQILKNVVNINHKKARDVMSPRVDIISANINSSIDDLAELVIKENYSRLPVYEDNLDNIIGFLHSKDILKMLLTEKDGDIKKILREAIFINPFATVLDVLREMRDKKSHLAIVIDEFGGVDGLLTVDDLIEEIVGEIDDEYDDDEYDNQVEQINDTEIKVIGRYEIDDLLEYLETDIASLKIEDIKTIGGLVSHIAGRIPQSQEVIEHESGLVFTILKSNAKMVEKVKIDISKFITPQEVQ